jgi:ferric-dicitrate binding protein FerR (iron transport regulator)
MTNAEHIGKLIFLYIRKEISKKEMVELEAWRQGSPINEETFQAAIDPEKILADLKTLEESRIFRLEKAPNNHRASNALLKSLFRQVGIRVVQVAASILLLISTFMGVTIYRFVAAHKHPTRDSEDQLAAVINFSDLLNNTSLIRGFLAGFAELDIQDGTNGWLIGAVPDTTRQARNVYYRIFTSDGNRLHLNFSDSTHIWLNSNTTIKYPSWRLKDSIHIYLTGEAYVHIPSGTKHMYEIKISPPVDSTTPSSFIEAVQDKLSRSMYLFSSGGDFYLKAYFGNDATTATLISGSLLIDSVAGKSVSPINLEPGQQAKLDSGGLQILKPEHISDLWSWKNR